MQGETRPAQVAHIHYLLFAGSSLLALVFQISDASSLWAVAPSLARIAGTLRVT